MIKQQKGFTVIEVALVLAIAALIFLMVFIALPALRRGQADQARKNDASTVAAAISTYKSNNKGSLTGLNTSTLKQYIERLDQYEITGTSNPLVMVPSTTPTASPTVEQISVKLQSKCGDAPAPGQPYPFATGTSRTAAVVVRLENSGSTSQFYCVDV